MNLETTALYAIPVIAAFIIYVTRKRTRESLDSQRYSESVAKGMNEPISLHPVFDPGRCISSGACVSACPEQAIGMINGSPQLVNAASCIGHGACLKACPTGAINLVFGTERRGVDIPQVDPHFETDVPGIFIAGELGGMGLIHKAVEQGKQAIRRISERQADPDMLHVVIVGAGPAGLSASLAAKEKQLRFVTLEQEASLGGTVYHFPRNKIVMTSPMQLPTVGQIKLGEVRKESLLDFWQGIVGKARLKVSFRERVLAIDRDSRGFLVKTSARSYLTRNILLAIGRRGTPRRLDVPGEEQPKVVYRLIDAEQYRGQHVLVVGGGDSAIEAAVSISAQSGTTVSLSYRGQVFNRIKPGNRDRLQEAESKGRVRVLMESEVVEIKSDQVVLAHADKQFVMRNDAVIVCAGGLIPTQFLRDIGVLVETHHGTA
jgi:thioredoxin reductase/NAD-dependent dihydropyrimidine dehydrogenase PreA subunit